MIRRPKAVLGNLGRHIPAFNSNENNVCTFSDPQKSLLVCSKERLKKIRRKYEAPDASLRKKTSSLLPSSYAGDNKDDDRIFWSWYKSTPFLVSRYHHPSVRCTML